MSQRRFAFFYYFAACCLLSACIGPGHYRQPELSKPGALLTLLNNGANSSSYEGYDNDGCIDNGRSDEYGVLGGFFWGSGPSETIRVLANKRLFIMARSQSGGSVSGNTLSLSGCVNVASFVPQANNAYKVIHLLGAAGCRISVVEETTQKQPSTFVSHKVKDSCE